MGADRPPCPDAGREPTSCRSTACSRASSTSRCPSRATSRRATCSCPRTGTTTATTATSMETPTAHGRSNARQSGHSATLCKPLQESGPGRAGRNRSETSSSLTPPGSLLIRGVGQQSRCHGAAGTRSPDRGCTLGHPSRVTIAIGGQDRMKLEGSYDIPVPRQQVWEAFLDPEKLSQAIPGCEKLEEIGPDEYKATMKIGIAAVKGTFQGTVRLRDKQPPESYRLNVDGSGGPGFVRGDTVITLSDAAGGTHV